MGTSLLVSTGAVNCYPAPIVKNLVHWWQNFWSLTVAVKNKKSPADAKGNARQRCTCEDPVWTKFKLTTMFHLDLTADNT